MDFDSKIDWVFVIEFLKILATGVNIDSISSSIPAEIDKDIEIRVSQLLKIANDINSNEALKASLVPNLDSEIVSRFELFLNLRSQLQSEIEEEQVINADISIEYQPIFRDKFHKVFLENTTLRNIFTTESVYQIVSDDADVLYWGIHNLDKKDRFLDRDSIVDMGEYFGRELAMEEDTHILQKIVADVAKEFLPKDKALADALNNFVNSAAVPIVVITFWIDSIVEVLKDVDIAYESTYESVGESYFNSTPNYAGHLIYNGKRIPVFQLPSFKTDEDYLVCFDAKSFILSQFDICPTNDYIFKMEITDLAKDSLLRGQIRDKNEAWLAHHSDKDRYLKQLVVLKILEKYKLISNDSHSVNNFKIIIKDNS